MGEIQKFSVLKQSEMEIKERVQSFLLSVLRRNESLFLIDLSVSPDGMIKVVLDGDQGVSLNDCIAISRALERKLEAEDLDFALEVTSPGATSPLTIPRQYKKHIGRKLQVRTVEGEVEGTLTRVTESEITLEWKSREPKPVGKGKRTVQKQLNIQMSDIKESKVKLTF